MAIFVASFGGFIFGYDLGALSAATQSLREQFSLSPGHFGLTISASLWGTVFGSILAGRLADQIGRRKLIAGCCLIYALAAVCITLPVRSEWELVLEMRFLCGMAIGGLTVGCPLYLSEVAPIAIRGRVVSLFQIQVGVGVIVAFSVAAAYASLAGSGRAWRWSLGLGALPALMLLFFMRFVTQQTQRPSDNRDQKCLQPDVLPTGGQLFTRKNTRPILIATSIAVFNQLSGVNIILLYMLDILTSAGINFSVSREYTVIISIFGLGTGLLGMALVDRMGRKPLLYVGSAGMALCLCCLGLTISHKFPPLLYLSILVTYNAFFAFSQGTVVWVYLSELFPPGVRGLGQGYGTTIHWIANATLILIFPSMQHSGSTRIFYIFPLMMVVQIVVIWRWYPETCGTSLGSFKSAGLRE